MADDRFASSLADTVTKLSHQFDLAVDRSAEMHRDGAADDAVLTETAVAVRTAMALECLTGMSWDERLERGASDGAAPDVPAPPSRRRRGRADRRRR